MSKEAVRKERIAASRRAQDPNELRRKALKSARKGAVWTQEYIDYIFADGVSDHVKSIHERLFGNQDQGPSRSA